MQKKGNIFSCLRYAPFSTAAAWPQPGSCASLPCAASWPSIWRVRPPAAAAQRVPIRLQAHCGGVWTPRPLTQALMASSTQGGWCRTCHCLPLHAACMRALRAWVRGATPLPLPLHAGSIIASSATRAGEEPWTVAACRPAPDLSPAALAQQRWACWPCRGGGHGPHAGGAGG